jgi:hypothetical protein
MNHEGHEEHEGGEVLSGARRLDNESGGFLLQKSNYNQWMPKKAISSGVVHKVPPDLRKALVSDKAALAAWEDITPLARNEWICWTISVKKAETRMEHIERLRTQLKEGKRRPCCWPGCPHRGKRAAVRPGSIAD